ncbi:response regulator [Larkinella soli]|uniref:response regulator n=1 Tax=Larkinella soli TaxID=1770527 RepID=UPI000FFB1B96|nr:response regulator [Larkinella soli]
MRLSLINRLYLGFFLAILLVLFVGTLSYLAFNDQVAQGAKFAHSNQIISKAQEIEKLLVDMETGRRGFRGTNEPRFLQPYRIALLKIEPTIRELQQLVSDNPPMAEMAGGIEKETEALLLYWQSLGDDASRYDRATIIRVTDQEKIRMDAVRQRLSRMINEEKRSLALRNISYTASIRQAAWQVVIGTALILGVVLVLIYFIIKEFKSRRAAEERLRHNLEELEQLNQNGTEKNWLLTGMSTVNDSMQGIEELPALAQNVLRSLTAYLDVPAGGLYCYSEEKQRLELCASVAFTAQAPRSYGLGEGLVGHAATDRIPTITSQVPAGYWSIRSGSGEAVPGQVVCVPLWNNRELKGLIELASFRPVDQAQLALLKAVAGNIAVAVNSTEARQKVMQLLEQVQHQKETLENQQEELRQSNEELTRQAEILQASEEELKVQEEELRQINAELEEKNEAVEVARQSLMLKAKELEVTGKYKSEFLANMSHELRTPLNSVLILANLLAENKNKNLTDKQIEYANVIHKSGTDLLNLINDILDLSKIEAGKIDMEVETVAVKTMVRDLEQLFQVVAEQKGVKLITRVDESLPASLTVARQRLEQVIKNLLSNAFKFTPSGGSVTLSFSTHGPMSGFTNEPLVKTDRILGISVTDTGIGIPESKQQAIFEAFQQADGSTSRKYGGTGLGLSISKELVKRLGGEIRLQSAEGRGSTFTLYLPLEPAVSQPAAAEPELSYVPAQALARDFGADEDFVEQTSLKDDRDHLQKGDPIMLIIEDDPAFAGIVQDFARRKNYKTIVALRGDEGIHYARKYKPSAIILDMQLPVVDGWSVLNWLKTDDTLKSIPVHVISAADEPKLLIGGALAYLRKPVEKEGLEKAFSAIGDFLQARVKKVLVLSGDHLGDDSLRQFIEQRQFEMECEYVGTVEAAAQNLGRKPYDCLIVDIGRDLEKGLEDLTRLREVMTSRLVPVIIYLDRDVSQSDERKLRKVSDAVIRKSAQSIERLMDEMELFLYKVQEIEKKQLPQPMAKVSDQSLRGKKVLLVDDDMRNVFALSTLLEEQQMNVLTAGDGREALDMLKENGDTDIVLMDVMMPEMDGYEATRRIRGDLKLLELPVIALTAKAMSGDREKAIEAGASDYITKPVDSGRLFSLMRVWLSR